MHFGKSKSDAKMASGEAGRSLMEISNVNLPVSPHGDAGKSRGRRTVPWNLRILPYALSAPAVIFFAVVIVYPLLQSLTFGLYDRSMLGGESTFVGLGNLQDLFAQDRFWKYIGNTFVFVVCSTLAAFLVALVAALALDKKMDRTALRVSLLLPWMMPGVVVSFIWMWIFDRNYGVLNAVLSAFGAQDVAWLESPGTAMLAITVAKTWNSFPWMMLLILSALQAVPTETKEAAALDGAKGLSLQRFVILPQIRGAIALTLLLETIWGLQHFEIPYVMTGGGPVGSTTVLSVDLYKTAFSKFDLGTAGAIGIVWTAIMAVVVVVYMTYNARVEKG